MNLSTAYAAVARARRRHYERHPHRQRRLCQPVVSVGNLSVGGTGKTPAVGHLARLLLAAGERPAILTRGYRRREPTEGVLVVSDGRRVCADVARAGDEPLMLARALPGVAVLVGADRHLSGVLAERRLGCSVHLLDDGFQHVRLHRDVDIVLVASEDLHDRVLPAGRLREDRSALAAADAIVVLGAGEAGGAGGAGGAGTDVEDALHAIAPSAMLFRARVSMPGPPLGAVSEGSESKSRVFAVAGIARPRRFFDLLKASGWPVAGQMAFRDHHWYSRADLEHIAAASRGALAELVVTTEKDLVRLLPLRPFPVPVVAVPLEFTIEPAVPFREWLMERLRARECKGEKQG